MPVALPPGIYTIRETVENAGVHVPGRALTSPDRNGEPLALEDYDADNHHQQFIVNGSGLIFASHNRHSVAHAQMPSLLHEAVKRSTTGVEWLVNVQIVAGAPPAAWRGSIVSPDEHKYYWSPNHTQTGIILRRAAYNRWTFTTVDNE